MGERRIGPVEVLAALLVAGVLLRGHEIFQEQAGGRGHRLDPGADRAHPRHRRGAAPGRQVREVYYSIGGGFVVSSLDSAVDPPPVPYPFRSGADLVTACESAGLSIAELMRRNECAWRSSSEVDSDLAEIWRVMRECVRWGCAREGVLPGGLNVPRRAKALLETLSTGDAEPQDWVSLFASAVNEENASGGRVVTAPTNGAAGIVPAVLHYYTRFVGSGGVDEFPLTAGAIGVVLKETGSISGAEVGCQGEVGSACAMAAAGLCAVLGGTVRQVENAAEIGLEHHLVLTCDPLAAWSRSRASNATPWPPSPRSPPHDWRCAATAPTSCTWTTRSPRCARPAPT